MKKSQLLGAICIFTLIYCQSSVVNASVIYTYTGNNYTESLGSDALYETTMSIQGSLELNSPLAPDLYFSRVAPLSFNFNDGINTYTEANSGTTFFSFATDSSGNIIAWSIDLDIPFPTPTAVGDIKPFVNSYHDPGIVNPAYSIDRAQILTCVSAAAGVCTSSPSLSWAQNYDVPGVWSVAVDTDNDGVFDSIDNCTLVQNPLQRDTDSDGYGNFCDPDFDNNLVVGAYDLAYFKSTFFTTDPDADLNGDGIVNAADLAILKPFFFQPPGPSYIGFTALTVALTSGRAMHTATLLNDGKVLITGGFSAATFPAPALNTAELYDPAANTFTALTSRMLSARTSHAATRLADGRVLLTGGQTNSDGDGTNIAELFDPATQTFTSVTAVMTSPRGGHASVLLGDGTVLIMGGFNNSCTSLNTAEIFDPSTQSFTALTSMMAAGRSELAATMLANGMVLLTGGGSCDNTYDTAELFDPITQSFTAISATMTALRGGHGSGRLTNGSVLVSGGGIDGSNPPLTLVVLDTAELFDPSTQRFSAISERMTATRSWHTQTTLSSGSVLLTGGLYINTSGFLVILDSAETFTPYAPPN